MNKKGLAINQVFVFMVAGLIFALIMIFGYQAISGFIDTSEDVLFTKFKTSIWDISFLFTLFSLSKA